MHILVPVDDSEPAQDALEYAMTMFPDAEITALHVINPSAAMYGGDAAYNIERVLELEAENAESLLEDARSVAEEHDATVSTETVRGTPARRIVEFAEEHAVDGLVIGSHGRSGVSRVLLGSVAEQVVRRSPVPVTVAR